MADFLIYRLQDSITKTVVISCEDFLLLVTGSEERVRLAVPSGFRTGRKINHNTHIFIDTSAIISFLGHYSCLHRSNIGHSR